MTLPLPLYPDKIFPKGFLQLCTGSSGLVECTVLFLHTLMLEVGYIPKHVDEYDMYERMPENWRGNHAYNISYYHKSIPYLFCQVTIVRVYSNLTTYGLLEDETDEKNTVYLNIKVADPLSLSCDTNKLTIKIKDEFCFPLLALLQERENFKPSFGLGGLISDCKHAILRCLDGESLVSISEVNKEFHDLANSPLLWKHLFTRDFDSGASSDEISSNTEDWKEKYKEEYKKRMIRTSRLPLFSRFVPPDTVAPWTRVSPWAQDLRPISPIFPPPFGFYEDEVDFRINPDPVLQQVFPSLRDRFHSSPPNRPFGIPPSHDRFDPWFF